MTGTVERARGRWREILPQLGIDTSFLRIKHGPCPLCGGKDRFRWDDTDGSGSYFCNQCRPGLGMTLVMKKNGFDFGLACREVDAIIGAAPPTQRTPRPKTDDRTGRLAACKRILNEAKDGNIVADYLRRRGLPVVSPVLLGHPALPYLDDGRYVRRCPAMLAPIIGPNGDLLSVHRTYLGDVPTRKKFMPPVAPIQGAAVRLFDPTDTLGIAEGIETALAAHELFQIPTWAVLFANGMESFNPPAGLSRLVILADNDKSFAGQKAAYALEGRVRRDGLKIDVEISPITGTDWLDVLNERKAA